ncbi:MAG: hypothetical protein ACRC37_00590 [Lentisphaeria bacterium]
MLKELLILSTITTISFANNESQPVLPSAPLTNEQVSILDQTKESLSDKANKKLELGHAKAEKAAEREKMKAEKAAEREKMKAEKAAEREKMKAEKNN